MNIPQLINILDYHARLHIRHGRAHIDNKQTVRESFDKTEFHIDRALAILKDAPLPSRPPKLVIDNGVLCFYNSGEDPLLAIGIARREILDRAAGHHGGLYGRPLKFFLDLTEEYGLNFERVDSVDDLNILGDYLDDRADKDIVVELTIADDERPEMGDPETIIDFVAAQGYLNVIIECWNEFGFRDERYIDDIRRWIKYANDKGLLTSAGAYDYKPVSEEFDPVVRSKNRIISIHRSYEDEADVKNTVAPYKNSSKPMSWNEAHHMSAGDFYVAAKRFHAEGVGLINGYFIRSHELFPGLKDDISPWREYHEKAKQLKEELSP